MSGDPIHTVTLDAARQQLENAEHTADRFPKLKVIRAAAGAGFAMLAIAEAATRIADAVEQGIASRKERGDWP